MPNDTTFESGFGGNVTINAKTFPVVSWSGQFPATILTYMNSKSGNHPVRASTFTDARVTVVIDWNLTDQPFLVSQGSILPGAYATNVILLLSQNMNDNWTITNMIVADTPQSVEIAGKIGTQLQLQISGGTITPPGGAPSY